MTKTRSEAWLLGGHTPVVMVEGISGGYLLDRVKAIQNKEVSSGESAEKSSQ